MDELIKAILAAYNGTDAGATALRAATPGGCWLSQAPMDARGAWVVLTPIASPIEYATGGIATAEAILQISFFALTAAEVIAALDAWHDLFFDNLLNGIVIYARPRTDGTLQRDSDSEGYMAVVEWKYITK